MSTSALQINLCNAHAGPIFNLNHCDTIMFEVHIKELLFVFKKPFKRGKDTGLRENIIFSCYAGSRLKNFPRYSQMKIKGTYSYGATGHLLKHLKLKFHLSRALNLGP